MTVFKGNKADVRDQIDLDDEAFQQQFLEGVAELANEAGDWRDHLPYKAALNFHEDERVRGQYETHVNDCAYCKELIETLRPSERMLGDLHRVARNKRAEKRESDLITPSYLPSFAQAAALVLLIFSVGYLGLTYIVPATESPGGISFTALQIDPTDLVLLEQSDNPVDRFSAARFYIESQHPQLAYQRVGEGFELTGMDASFVSKISNAPMLENNDLVSLRAASIELEKLSSKDGLSRDEYVRLIQLQAQLGEHDDAFHSLAMYLRETGANQAVIDDYTRTLVSEIQ